jgi:hypothetical protein
MPEFARRGQCAPFECVDIAPELKAKIMIADMLSSWATPLYAGTAIHSGAETIRLDAARVRHISR